MNPVVTYRGADIPDKLKKFKGVFSGSEYMSDIGTEVIRLIKVRTWDGRDIYDRKIAASWASRRDGHPTLIATGAMLGSLSVLKAGQKRVTIGPADEENRRKAGYAMHGTPADNPGGFIYPRRARALVFEINGVMYFMRRVHGSPKREFLGISPRDEKALSKYAVNRAKEAAAKAGLS